MGKTSYVDEPGQEGSCRESEVANSRQETEGNGKGSEGMERE